MQQFMVNVSDPKSINLVDLSAASASSRSSSTASAPSSAPPTGGAEVNQQNAAHFGVIRGGGHDIGDAEAFEPYDELSVELLNDIDKNLTSAASDARGLAIANAVITAALLLAAILLALLVSRMLLNPIRRVREGALEVANTRLPEMVAKIRAGGDPGEITRIPVDTHEEMGRWPARSTTCTDRPCTWPPARRACARRSARCSRPCPAATPRSSTSSSA